MATSTNLLIDLSDRAKFRLTGADRIRYLNGQVSNDVTRADGESAIEACVCNVKGKLDGVVFITASNDGEEFLIDAPGELRESLGIRLERYIIADDCELQDITGDQALVHSPGKPQLDLPGARWRKSNRFGPDGFDLWVTPDSLAKVLQSGGMMDPGAVEEMRILHSIPRWGAELSAEVLPAEAGLDRRAVDFQKGCYLGQEVVSRIESVGRVNRVLAVVVCTDPAAELEPGAEVFASEDGGKAIGTVTSSIYSEKLGRFAGLAFLKRDFSEPGTELAVSDQRISARVESEQTNG